MNKKTLSLILAISTTYLSSFAFAEEPFIGLGIVNHVYEQDPKGSAIDVEAKPSSYRLTIGSRIAKNYIIEAFYLSTKDKDEITISGGTILNVEYEAIIGASINYALYTGPFTIYIGPSVTAAKLKGTVDNSSGTISAIREKEINRANDFDARVSPGIGAGIDLTIYKNVSLNLHAESYLIDGDRAGTGTGIELRYHL